MSYLIGIDIGTTGTKTLLCDEKGNIIARALAEYPMATPKPGWAEQNPEDWWNATVTTIKEVLHNASVRPEEIKGIGLSGQMHGAVALDREHKVLRPCIMWCDQRTAAECDYITDKVGKDKLVEITCNPALTGFTAPKIIWMRNKEPRLFEKTDKFLLPKDYIRFRLTGTFATEVSDASGTTLFDVWKRCWSKEILESLELSSDLLPEVFESPIVSGQICNVAAAATGLPAGTPVVGGGGDQAAGAVGNGIIRSGIISSTLGTSGVVFASTDEVKLDPKLRVHTFCHAVPGKWHVMGVMLAAGGSFRWLRDTIAGEEKEAAARTKVDPYEIMTTEAAKVKPGSEGLIFLPYLMGERTPYADPFARGVFFGLTVRHQKAHLIRSVMEGVSFGLRDSLEIMKELSIDIQQVRASGGGARSTLWRQIQADINNTAMVTINVDEGPAFGVALLAGVGAKIYQDVAEACKRTIKDVSYTNPVAENVPLYENYYRIYRTLYPILKENFTSLAELVK